MDNNDDVHGVEEDDLEDEWNEWDRTRLVTVVQLICDVVHVLSITSSVVNRAITEKDPIYLEREQVRQEIMSYLRNHDVSCHNLIRMRPDSLHYLCDKFQSRGLLRDTKNASIEEQVVIFLIIIAQKWMIRTTSTFFRRSNETISRHFNLVLRAVIALEDEYLKQLDGSEVPPEVQNNTRYFPYFKDCIGASDGTHIRVKVSKVDAPRFRGRKEHTTQNVLAACSFDLRFTYVLPGWEGSASDSRIIKNASTREDNLKISQGKYYLVDARFMLRSGLIAPYRSNRYHLKEYSALGPQNALELFNLRHASLRTAVERAFGVLKKRFPIIGSANEKTYSFDVQCEIVLACCILHNFLMGVDPDERLIAEVDSEISNRMELDYQYQFRDNDNEDARLGAALRDSIAAEM